VVLIQFGTNVHVHKFNYWLICAQLQQRILHPEVCHFVVKEVVLRRQLDLSWCRRNRLAISRRQQILVVTGQVTRFFVGEGKGDTVEVRWE